ncbi:MAG: penicillin-binding protein [Winogradskyella sp.]|uniref:penicillin-binding protein 1A n=1 Tax=Winogradskyella sp. TaxID=1883156 RepID=UPI001814A0D3|nr:penicillin-binding protein [Winogradskyella sp.]
MKFTVRHVKRLIAKAHYQTRKRWIKWPLILVCLGVLCLTALYVSVYLGAFGHLPNKAELRSIKQEQSTQILDKDGVLIGKYYIYDRQPLKFQDFPKHLLEALVATEDIRFYEHEGIDNTSLLRVFFKSVLLQDDAAGGGSTITLQLAKNLFGRDNYPIFGIVVNKFKESVIAKRLEDIYSKEEILTLYLNTVPFSDNTYGIESASRKFFNKSAKELTINEAATLVGTLKANHYYNPRINTERCQQRRNVVLNQMQKYGYLNQDSLNIYRSEPVKLNYRSFSHDVGLAPYFRAEVKRELAKILDSIPSPLGRPYNLYKDGLIVHTTLDAKMQNYAEEAMKEHLSKLQASFEKSYGKQSPWINNRSLIDAAVKNTGRYKNLKRQGLTDQQIEDSLNVKRKIELFRWEGDTVKTISVIDSIKHFTKFLNTGMIAIEPTTGKVRTYVGGIDFRYFKYDHVSQSERQVGSTFKPFVYTAAIDSGMEPCTYYPVSEITYTNYNNWTPKNSGGIEADSLSKYSLKLALSQSVNTIAVKVLNDIGISSVISMAERMGISTKLPKEPSIALGTAAIKLKDIAGAFATYTNESKWVKPYYITKIEDRYGNVLCEFEPTVAKKKAFKNYTRQVLLEMMKETVNSGTASRLRSTYGLTNAMAGKTGTTQDNKDGWFIGITPNLTTVTWVGNDNHSIGFRTTSLGQGANTALPIFAKFYQKLNNDSSFDVLTKSKFEYPWKQVIEDLDCEPVKAENFFERLFKRKKERNSFK